MERNRQGIMRSGWPKYCVAGLAVAWLLTSYLAGGWPERASLDPALLAEPIQTPTTVPPFSVRQEGVEYTLTPRYDYTLHGLVVSEHDTDSLFNYYHTRWGDHLNVKDLCVVWGSNVATGVYSRVSYSSGSWTCYYKTSDREAWRMFNNAAISNNHVLTNDPRIAEALRDTKVGDQIKMQGVLAEYSHAGGFHRGTSVSRTDTGNGACETIFLMEYEVLARHGEPWRTAQTLTGYSFFGGMVWLAITFGYRLFGPPPTVGELLEERAQERSRPDLAAPFPPQAATPHTAGSVAAQEPSAQRTTPSHASPAPPPPPRGQSDCQPAAAPRFRPPWLDEE